MRVSLALCALLLPLSTCVGADSSDTEEPPPEILAAAAADDAALEAAVAAGGDTGAAVLRLAAARHASALARISHSPRVQEPTLALLRSAARLVPASAAYWNDLGVFELRRGMHKKAQQRFQRALRADPPGHAEARANLARLHAVYWDDGALPKTLLHDHDRVEIEHGLTNLTRVHVDDLAKPSFQHYRLGAVPYILTGAVTRERGYDAAWWSLRRQGELFPKSPTDFYPQGMNSDGIRTQPWFTPVPDAVRQLTTGIFEKAYEDWDASLTTAYMQWNIDHVDWKVMEPQLEWLPPLMTSDFRWVEQCWSDNAHRARFLKDHHWRIMIVGQRGAGMFNHKDTLRTASWQVIFQGPKRMQLCPPHSDPHIYQAGDLDTFAPDYVRFPRARNLTCFWAELASGEILYYPRDWWHHTKNLSPDAGEPTYALTGTLVNPDNFDSVTEQMIQTYVGEGKNVLRVGEHRNIECAEGQGGEGSFCDGLLKCFDRWARTFGRQHFLGVEAAASEEEIAAASAAGEPRMMVRKAAIPMDRPYDEALTAKFEELNRQLVVGEVQQPEYEDKLATLMSIHGCPFENGLWRCKEHRSTNAGTTTTKDDEE